KSINPFVDALTLYDLLKEFRRNKPDIILLYTIKPNIYGNLAAAFTGLKTISNVAGLGTVFSRSGVVQVLVKWLYRMVLKYPEKVFFQNREDMKLFIREKLVAPHLVEYVPGSGVDLQRFSPKHNLTVDNDSKIHFLLFTRMLWDKGVGEYVEAAHSILDQGYDVEFRLLGFLDADNPGAISEKDMDELTKRQGIDYAGVSDKIEDEISIADCVVLPTYYPEGTPKALLEAAAMAKPIITTDTAGCRDVVDDGSNGFLCKARDAESLA
ncbi:MAG: glycosyltransferase family 4 protein, partial [Desulfobacterales bacterium]|nr:glycosyltransferase family 4 protein [Desulfobacterales bacterium]